MTQLYLRPEHQLYDTICRDLRTSLLHLVSEPAHGKSNFIKSIVSYAKSHSKYGDLEFVVVDPSISWWHNSPLEKRQRVNRRTLCNGSISNEYDCVYYVGELSDIERRAFVGELLGQHQRQRTKSALEGTLDDYPTLVLILEEADTYLSSYSLRAKDQYASILNDFVSISRNLKIRGIAISTASTGSVSPSLRKRSRKIYGRVINEGDLNEARRIGNTVDLRRIQKYTFTYDNKIKEPNLVKQHTPQDYRRNPLQPAQEPRFNLSWWIRFLSPIVITWLFFSYFI